MHFGEKKIVNWSILWYMMATACVVFIVCILGVNNDNSILYIFLAMVAGVVFYHLGKIADAFYAMKLKKAKRYRDGLSRRLRHDYNMKELRVELIEAYVREECRAIIP